MGSQASEKEVLKTSRFLHSFTRDGATCLLHSLACRKVYGGQILQSIHDAFAQPMCVDDAIDQLSAQYPSETLTDVIADLREKKMLVPDRRDDLAAYVSIFERGMSMYKIQHMYFIPTTGCNFRCKYCFVEDEGRPFAPATMSIETARKGLELFAKLSEEASKISLTFYGGEPLLNAEVVYFAMRYVRELEQRGAFTQPVSMSLLTNGSLVDDNTVAALMETDTRVSVSIDGPQPYHDAARGDVNGQATYAAALAGFRKLQEAQLFPGVSCTLSRSNIDHIEEIATFIATELKPGGMGFNVLLPRVNASNPAEVPHEYAASQLIAAFKILREHGIYEDRMMRRVRPFTEGHFHMKDCMGVGGQIVLTPEGRLGPCQAFLGLHEYFPLSVDELHARLPEVTSDDVYEPPLFDEWRHRFPANMEQCTDCFAISICGGGCPYASLVNHGSLWELDDRICSQAKQIMEWMIWDTYEHLLADTASA